MDNKLEYIPGDLVMVKESALQFAKDKIFKVISSLSGGFLKVVMLNDSSTTYSISNNAIRPIPLTPEILEKNGWMLYHLYYWFVEKECLKLRLLEFDNYTWSACIGGNVIRINMCSVSDLQHILFGLGINHKMEV